MKKIIIFMILAVIMTVIFTVVVENINEIEEETYTITEPYDFPIKPGTEEWKNLKERFKATEIPDDVLKKITTSALVRTVLNYPFLNDIYYLTNRESALKKMITKRKGLQELLNRKDSGNELIRYYKSLSENEINELDYQSWHLNNIEMLLLNEEIFSQFDKEIKLNLMSALLDKQIIRKKMNLNSYTFTAELLAKIMEDANYAPYNKLIEEYDKTKENKIDRIESKNTKYSELATNIIELSRKFYYAEEGKYERK